MITGAKAIDLGGAGLKILLDVADENHDKAFIRAGIKGGSLTMGGVTKSVTKEDPFTRTVFNANFKLIAKGMSDTYLKPGDRNLDND